MLALILFWLLMGGVVAIIANSKGYDPAGWFLYGVLIWPIALVHILTKSPEPRSVQAAQSAGMKKCADCAELVKADARKCRYCGRVFPEPAATKPRDVKMRSLDRFK